MCFLLNRVQLAAVNCIFAGGSNITISYIGDFLVTHVDAIAVDYRTAVVDGQAVCLQVFGQVEGNVVVAGSFADNNVTVGVVQVNSGTVSHGRAVGSLGGQREAAFLACLVGYQFQLVFGRCLAAGDAVRIPGFVGQSANGAGVAVDGNGVAASARTDIQHIGQTHVDAAGIGAGNDVSVAFNGYAVAQFFHTGVAAVGGKGQTFVVHCIFGINAFFDVVFNFVCQSDFVAGNVGGDIRSSRYHSLVIYCFGFTAFCIDSVGVGSSIVIN